MRPVFASTAAVARPRELWAILDAYAAAGIERVELGFSVASDAPELGDRLRDRSFEYLVHNYFPPPVEEFVLNLASADADTRQRSLALARRGLELAAELGAPFYSVHAGFITDPIDFDGTSYVLPEARPGQADEAWRRFVEGIEQTLADADELGVGLLVETSVCTEDLRGKLLLLEADELERLFAEISSPRLGLLVDTGHLTVTAATLGFDPATFLRRVTPHVRALHLHQNAGVVDSHEPIDESRWVLDAVRDPALADAVAIVEAKFDDAEALAAHVRLLEEALP